MTQMIAEFHGRESIAEAGMAVLKGPECAAIVRGALGTSRRKRLAGSNIMDNPRALSVIYESMPELSALDRVVRDFLSNHLLSAFLTPATNKGRGITGFGLAKGPTRMPHYDSGEAPLVPDIAPKKNSLGPLAGSLRLDNTEATRTFKLFRGLEPTVKLIDGSPHITHAPIADLAEFASVAQHPGDFVLFGNEPWATQHHVEEDTDGKDLTRALLLFYHFDTLR